MFKVLEILNDNEICVHMTFTHVFYGFGENQRLYLSDDLEYMLERLKNQRVFLYKRQREPNSNKSYFQIVRRLYNFPQDMSEACNANYLFSPNLMLYMDYDRAKN